MKNFTAMQNSHVEISIKVARTTIKVANVANLHEKFTRPANFTCDVYDCAL